MIRLNAFPLKVQQVLCPLLVGVIAIIAFFIDSSLFHFQRDLFVNGELWRGLTAHFLHTNINHLLLNISAVILLWAVHGQFYNVKNYIIIFICSSIMATLGIYYFSPEIDQYVGLSGVLHGFFMWGALKDIEHNDKTGYLLLLGVLIKIVHEQIAGPSQDVAELINATVAIDAHLWGAIGGGLVGLTSIYLTAKNADIN